VRDLIKKVIERENEETERQREKGREREGGGARQRCRACSGARLTLGAQKILSILQLRWCECGDQEGKRLMSVLRLEVEMHLQRDCQPRPCTHQRQSEAHTEDRVRQVNELKEGEGRKKYKMQGGPWWVMY